MPFTFSHPALVIPLLRSQRYQRLSATGLIVGSIAPDFEKFFKLQLASEYSHTLSSIFYFSCPVGLGLAFIFHLVVRRPLLAHLPAVLYKRLSQYATFDWSGYFRLHAWEVLLSIILGAALHLAWDSVTHYNELTRRLFPVLATSTWFGARDLLLFEALEIISSVVGLLAIGWAVWQMPACAANVVPYSAVQRYWGMVTLVTAGLTTAWVVFAQPIWLNASISAISAMLASVILVSGYTGQQ